MKTKFLTLLSASLLMTSVYAATPNDAEIAKIVETTNNGEIALAKLAKEKTADKGIVQFADHMIADHSMNNEKAVAIATRNNMIPVESMDSKETKLKGDATLASLKKLTGDQFKKAYIMDQILTHEKVLKKFETSYIPAAKNPELKALLMDTKTKVEAHLKHAKEIQKSL